TREEVAEAAQILDRVAGLLFEGELNARALRAGDRAEVVPVRWEQAFEAPAGEAYAERHRFHHAWACTGRGVREEQALDAAESADRDPPADGAPAAEPRFGRKDSGERGPRSFSRESVGGDRFSERLDAGDPAEVHQRDRFAPAHAFGEDRVVVFHARTAEE